MTNVIPFQLRPTAASPGPTGAPDTATVLSELVAIAGQIRAASEDASGLPYPTLQIERTVQSLLDAISAVERAAQMLTNDGRVSF